ncbi:MAG: xanthine dehydrogenase accessory factor [Polyangiales bacterium]|jgi:xanthine dehydrogenase accessory factor
MSLYGEELVALAARACPLPSLATLGEAHNPLCGDVVKLGVYIANGRIEELGAEVQGCLVCRASAALLVEALRGAKLAECADRLAELEALLTQTGDSGGMFSALARLESYPSRHVCALLPWRALEDALHERPRVRSATSARALASLTSVERPSCEPDDVWARIDAIRARDGKAALVTLVTLVTVRGSSPCPLGSRMVVASTGEFWGSVSGGCVESAVAQAALELLRAPSSSPSSPPGAAPSRLLTFRIANSQAGEVGLPCGGEIRVHIARAPSPKEILDIRKATRAGSARVMDLASGAWWIADDVSGEARVQEAVERVLGGAEAIEVEDEGSHVFVEALREPPRLILVGGTHIAQKLAALAGEIGFRPVLVDPRPAFAAASRFGAIEVHLRQPRDVLPELIDARSAVVLLSHNAEIDDPSLGVALRSEAFYIGALGSRRTQRERLVRLRAAGLSEQELARLHGPAGVPIGGQGAAEIALSILAEVVSTRRRAGTPRRVGAVVLAAGTSSRAGKQNKLLAIVDGKAMVRRVVETTLEAASPVVVVLGHEAGRVREALEGLEVNFVHNKGYASGMGTSIAAGIAALRAMGADAALVALGDMPFVRAEDLHLLVAAHTTSTQHLIVAPESGRAEHRRLGNPVLWPNRYFDALEALDGDVGGKVLMLRSPGAVLRIPIDDVGVLRDMDRV